MPCLVFSPRGHRAPDDVKMTHDVPTARGHDFNSTEPDPTSVDESEAALTHKIWTMDDEEGLILNMIDDVVAGSVGQAIGELMRRRLFSYVAAGSWTIIQEMLGSAIAPTGDAGVDSHGTTASRNATGLLGCPERSLQMMQPPQRCPMDISYQRRQVPMKAVRRDTYDSESLHRAVKAATRSHTHPASITSSRMTMKSRMRRKLHGATTEHAPPTGPQPGVPYSTEDPHSKPRHHVISPRKAKTLQNAASSEPLEGVGELELSSPGADLSSEVVHSDTKALGNSNGASGSQPHRSPLLSQSPSSTASSRRRPHPPGSAQGKQVATPLCFAEKEDEVKVEFAIPKSPPKRKGSSINSVLPGLVTGKMTPKPSFSFASWGSRGAFTTINDEEEHETESLFDEDPLDQHFTSMPLSPGVKLQAGEDSTTGPELPPFQSRMRRSTFVVSGWHSPRCT